MSVGEPKRCEGSALLLDESIATPTASMHAEVTSVWQRLKSEKCGYRVQGTGKRVEGPFTAALFDTVQYHLNDD
jgi:hypothetical protein